MLAEGRRFPQNYCAGGRETAVYELVTTLLAIAIRAVCTCEVGNDQLKRALRRFPQKAAQPKNDPHAGKLMIVVVVVPIVVRAPPMPILIPPPVVCFPATFALLCEFMAPVVGLLAVGAVMLNGLVQVMVNFRDIALAIVVCADWRGRKCQKTGQCCHRRRYLYGTANLRTILHGRYVLLSN
jgi:hypothetical protein